MRNNYALVVSASFLIAALSVAYYYVVFLPKKFEAEQSKIRMEQLVKSSAESEKQKNIDACLKTAYDNYEHNWNLNCTKFGINKKTDGCSLQSVISDALENSLKEQQEFCLKRYN